MGWVGENALARFWTKVQDSLTSFKETCDSTYATKSEAKTSFYLEDGILYYKEGSST